MNFNQKEPKVSVIIPIFNAEKYLEKCIDSILTQEYSNLEIIIINDGSMDNSERICKDYCEIDERIMFLNQKNQGVSYTRNQGILKSSGEFIVFIDADDYIEKEYIKNMVNRMNDEVDIVICNYNIVNKEGNVTGHNCEDRSKMIPVLDLFKNYWENYHKGYINAPWNKLYKKAIIDKYNIKFPVDISMGEDGYFNIEYLKKCRKIYIYEEYLYNFRQHNSQTTKKLFKNHFYMLNKFYDQLENAFEKFDLMGDIDFLKVHYLEYLNDLKLSLKYLIKDKTLSLSKKKSILDFISNCNRTLLMLKYIQGKNLKEKVLIKILKESRRSSYD